MLAEARRKHPDLRMIRADLDEPYGWPVVEQTFALCISAGVYECLSDPVGFLARARKQLERGGWLVFTFDEFVPAIRCAGLRVPFGHRHRTRSPSLALASSNRHSLPVPAG